MKKNKPFVMIMAGGSGTRLWPISRQKKPKQLIALYSKHSLIEETIKRAEKITPLENIIIGTNKNLKNKIRKALPYMKNENFLVEPVPRNTAPIIAYFTAWLRNKGIPDSSSILILSADHYISPLDHWIKLIQQTEQYLSDKIWCFGIKPSRPETGYGYIETGNSLGFDNGYQIRAFHEKPDSAKAKEYLSTENFLWNSGMFYGKLGSFEAEFKEHAALMYSVAIKCAEKKKNVKTNFPEMETLPFDIAIMEKTKKAGVLLSDFTWDDVGSYESLPRIWERDHQENFTGSNVKYQSIDSKGNIILSDTKKIKIAINGIQNSLIVINKNIVFVSSREKIDNIKKMRELFDEKDR